MIQLKKVTRANMDALTALSVRDDQKSFVADNRESLIDAYKELSHGGCVFPFGIFDGETPVGFALMAYDVGAGWEEGRPEVSRNNYLLWRLMIDQRYQGRGFGRAAMEQIMRFLKTRPCGGADCCWLSYEPENTVAKALYRSFGFVETEEKIVGENIAVLPL